MSPQPDPRPGQVWEDRDPRENGRRVVVQSVDGHFVTVRSAKRRSTMRIFGLLARYRYASEGQASA